jgi:hypothetical protein
VVSRSKRGGSLDWATGSSVQAFGCCRVAVVQLDGPGAPAVDRLANLGLDIVRRQRRSRMPPPCAPVTMTQGVISVTRDSAALRTGMHIAVKANPA